jgi:hypothetical protein
MKTGEIVSRRALCTTVVLLAAGLTCSSAYGATQIGDPQGLAMMAADLSGSFELIQDINATDFHPMAPIGSFNEPFAGSLDGKGFVIRGLRVLDTQGNGAGMFGAVSGTVSNLRLLDPNIVAAGFNAVAGGLAGYLIDGGRISQCAVERGTVSVLASAGEAGGLVGIVANAYTQEGGTVTECFSGTSVWGTTAGGLVGTLSLGEVANSYANGRVVSPSGDAGGLVGGNHAKVKWCYADCVSVDASPSQEHVGALVGEDFNNCEYVDCFCNSDLGLPACGNRDLAGVQSIPTDSMRDSSTYASWSDTVWMKYDGRTPLLRWALRSPVAVITVDPAAAEPSGAMLYYAPVDANDQIKLDGSGSIAPDQQSLTYVWSEGTNVLSEKATATVSLPPGRHTSTLTVGDGHAWDAATVDVTVIGPASSPSLKSSPKVIGRTSPCQDVKFYLLLPAGPSVSDIDWSEPLWLYSRTPQGQTLQVMKLTRDALYNHKHRTLVAVGSRQTLLSHLGPANGKTTLEVSARLKSGSYAKQYVLGTVQVDVTAGSGSSMLDIESERLFYWLDSE